MKVTPFKAVRPTRDKVHLVASRSYVSYTRTQLKKKLHENPFSFLHIIHPDLGAGQLHKTKDFTARYSLVRKKYEQFKQESILLQDQKPCFYIYRQTKRGHSFTGIICGVSITDFENGKVKRHEQTLSKREVRFTEYLDATRINAEPVLLTYEGKDELGAIIDKYTSQRPEYDFTQVTKVQHSLWVMDDSGDIAQIHKAFEHIPELYIADGHHRCASSLQLFHNRQKNQNDSSAFFLSFVLHESNVKIYDFNRLIRDLGEHSEESFLKKLNEKFEIFPHNKIFKPLQKGEISMYLNHKWYCIKTGSKSENLDAQILTDEILHPLLNISDLRNDKRISFLEGPQGMEGLKRLVDRNKYKVAFGLYPVSTNELKTIANNNQTMPPKSTWIEPKLRSGLVIYELD